MRLKDLQNKYLFIAVLIFVSLVVAFLMLATHMRDKLIRESAISHANLYVTAIEAFRSVYTAEVVSRINRDTEVEVRHDYHASPGAVPLPATLSMLLGEKIGERFDSAGVKLYSAYPFPWRQREGGLQDKFSEEAWQFLQNNTEEDFYAFVEGEGGLRLRYARADTLRPECVNCHNEHPETPKNDWQVGDVRGVLEVDLPLGDIVASGTKQLYQMFTVFIIVILLAFFLFLRIFRELRSVSLQLEKKTDHLQQEVARRSEAEQQALENQFSAEQASEAKSEFLAVMSHELRTPMNAIIGFTQLLRKKDRSFEDREKLLNKIHHSSKMLLDMINNILDLGKIESGKIELEYEEVNLVKEIQIVISIFHQQAKQKGLQLSMQVSETMPEPLYGDAARVKQVLSNAVSNAIKFSHQGEVAIDVKHLGNQANVCLLEFRVRDSGIGMSAEQIKTVFEPFVQANTGSTREYGGTGLGLNICKQLVELMGGEIQVQSQLNEGCELIWTLYLGLNAVSPPTIGEGQVYDQAAAASDNANFSPEENQDFLNILVAEHQTLVQKELIDVIATLNMPCKPVSDGKSVLKALRQQRFDVIFIDINLPEANAFELVQHVKHNNNDVLVVGIETEGVAINIENCLEAGMYDYIEPPLDFDKIEKLLIRVMREKAEGPGL